jgi:hypothetical protein
VLIPSLGQTAVRGPKLTILSAGREDEGEYICTATAGRASGQARAQLYVRYQWREFSTNLLVS